MAIAGKCMSASRAGGTVLQAEKTKKLPSPWSLAARIEAATVGAVVSKPTPRNTVFRAGFSAAIFTASKVE